MNVSYKPQKISPKFPGTVRQLLHNKIRDSYIHPQFITDVIKPLAVDYIMDQEVLNLSGGELQRVALTLCLGQVSCLRGTGKEVLWGMYGHDYVTDPPLRGGGEGGGRGRVLGPINPFCSQTCMIKIVTVCL